MLCHPIRLPDFPIATCVISRDLRYVTVNRAYADLFGEEPCSFENRLLKEFLPRRIVRKMASDFLALNKGEAISPHMLRFRHADYLVSISSHNDQNTCEICSAIICLTDVTCVAKIIRDQRRQAAKLATDIDGMRKIADEDALTGLPNRRALDAFLYRELEDISHQTGPVSLAIIDIDFFKSYNDAHGHVRGDQCLQSVGASVHATISNRAFYVARYGGEEFVVVAPNTTATAMHDLCRSISDGIEVLAIPHPNSPLGVVSVSIGHATAYEAPGRGRVESAKHTLLAEADTALYYVKANGKNNVWP